MSADIRYQAKIHAVCILAALGVADVVTLTKYADVRLEDVESWSLILSRSDKKPAVITGGQQEHEKGMGCSSPLILSQPTLERKNPSTENPSISNPRS